MRASRFRVDFFDRDHRRRFAANVRGVVGFGSIILGGGGGVVAMTRRRTAWAALFSRAVQPAPREEPVEHLMMMSRVRCSQCTHLFFDESVRLLVFKRSLVLRIVRSFVLVFDYLMF